MNPDNVIPMPGVSGRDGSTILVVDDEHGVRQLLAAWAISFGHTAVAAADADAALEAMRTSKVDVAIVDIRMPGKDGVWLIERLREEFPETAIIIATGLPDMRPELTLSPGIAGYLVKPFQREQFKTVLDNALTPDSPWLRAGGTRPIRNPLF
jgi:CheY-like chemotaxis protein